MNRNRIWIELGLCTLSLLASCIGPSVVQRKENRKVPENYSASGDTVNSSKLSWKEFFTDSNLAALIDTALRNNQELNIVMQEINIAKNDVRARRGAYLPMINLGGGAGLDKAGHYTRSGTVEKNLEIVPGKENPEPLTDVIVGANMSWEADIWKKLRNAKKSSVASYLASIQGKNFMVTQLVSEIANSYYELLALDNQLDILKKNIEIQQSALEIVRMEKQSAKVTELAVKKFEAEVLKNQSHQYYIQQNIIETENRLNFLVGRFPQPVQRNSQNFIELASDTIHAGIPSQLLANRPDIIQSEQQLIASKLNVKSAKAEFYPNVIIKGGAGYQAFNTKYLLQSPESMIYSLAGELIAPLVNRNAIKAEYYSANSRQLQAVINYERCILNAYIEVSNQLANISNLKKSFELKARQVGALTQSVNISTILFKSARADYMEVLLTQRDALESKFDLVETKMQQMHARIGMYKALGGGWR